MANKPIDLDVISAKLYDHSADRIENMEKKQIYMDAYTDGYVMRHLRDAKSKNDMLDYLSEIENTDGYFEDNISEEDILRLFIKANQIIREFVDNFPTINKKNEKEIK